MANTTRTEIAAEVNNFYSRNLFMRAVPYFVHTKFAQVRDVPTNSGTDTIKFRLYGNLTANTTALSEGVTPAGTQLSTTDTTATVLYYGDYVTLTDKLQTETYDPILTETSDILGDQAGDSLDQLCRNVLVATTNKQYASTATDTDEVTAAMKLTRDEVKEAVRTLDGANAKRITRVVNPSTGYNTVPLNRAYVGIVHPSTVYDLDNATGWVPVEKYANKSDLMENEVGSLAGVRFVQTTNAYVESDGGLGAIDVYHTLVIGQEAYGISRLSGKALQNIVKPLGSAGSADPLDQRSTSGWKATFVAKILNQNFLVDIEHAVSA